MPSNKLLQAAAGSAGGDNLFVEDVFSTYLYQGNSSSPPTITNNIDLSNEGGLVWIKARTGSTNHVLTDTVRGAGKELSSDVNWAEQNYTGTYGINSFNNNGFSLIGANAPTNTSAYTYTSWSWRKAKGWFDIISYSGNGVAGRNISHALGSSPKMMIVKRTDSTSSWWTWHVGIGTNYILLNSSNPQAGGGIVWNNTAPTSTVFTVADDANTNGGTFVAYLFGVDASFGEGGDEQICKIDSYTGTGSNGNTINLGFEPQWVLWKPYSGTGDWQIVDSMRGWTADGVVNRLEPNTSDTEATSGGTFCNLTSTGFVQNGSSGSNNASGTTYIYMAIRRPMKVPEAGTEVYSPTAFTGNGSAVNISSGFPVDLAIPAKRTNTVYFNFRDRLRGPKETLQLQTRNAEYSNASVECQFDRQDGIRSNGTNLDSQYNANNQTSIIWQFKRASKFFDIVHYVGNGSVRTINHNLKVTPEMIWVKCRDQNGSYWVVYDKTGTATDYLYLDSTNAQGAFSAYWNDTEPTSTVFTLGTGNGNDTNASSQNYIAYLFATLAGVSKVGSVVHSGTTNVDCGFSNGARFVLVKRTDSSGDWYVWDSVRGIVSGNDPYLLLNTTSAQVTNTDYIDPLASGFTLTSSFTAGTYIFLAIA